MSDKGKIAYFFPLSTPYMLTGYKNETDDLEKEKVFLIMNSRLESIQELIFTINDILKVYFEINDYNIYHRLVMSANLQINFESRAWKNIDFLINLTNMQFSGTTMNNSGQIELFDLQQSNKGIVRKCDLLCYINKSIDSSGNITYTEEFAFEEYHDLEDKIKVMTTKRIENYDYHDRKMTIFEDMLTYMDNLLSNMDKINWSWGEE